MIVLRLRPGTDSHATIALVVYRGIAPFRFAAGCGYSISLLQPGYRSLAAGEGRQMPLRIPASGSGSVVTLGTDTPGPEVSVPELQRFPECLSSCVQRPSSRQNQRISRWSMVQ